VKPLEWIAAALVLANIVLVARRNLWNFPVAVVAVALYAVVFWEAHLYSMAGLQLFFIAVNLYGWWAWTRDQADEGEIQIRWLSPTLRFVALTGSLVAVALWGWVMQTLAGGAFPYADAAGAMLSVMAQLLLVWRYAENWWWWIVVNLISIVLFTASGLHVSAVLYMINWGLAVWGLVEWTKTAKAQRQLP
jgi:nicotinamide mononucleotide transporter